jgi:hypothetical protein
MKRFLLFVFSIFLSFSIAIAQDGINYQGAATDVNGDELTNQNITIRASVLSGGANGNLEWEETHSATTDQFGLFNVVIGQGTNTTNGATATFNDMNWGSTGHYLKIEMDATGGTNYAMIGTTQMMSVPYALYAKSAGSNTTIDSLSQVVSNLDSLMGIITPFFGCTDPAACNYDANAVIDNGLCSGLLGCMDAQSSNYNASATCDDGSCIPYVGMYAFGGVVYKVVQGGSTYDIYVCNVHHQVYTPNNSGVSGIASGLTTNGYTDWIAPSTSQLDDLCQQRAVIDLVGYQNGGTVTFASNDPYLGTGTACNGTNNGAGPFSYPYWMSSCSIGSFSGNCCCLTSSGYFRSIRIVLNWY